MILRKIHKKLSQSIVRTIKDSQKKVLNKNIYFLNHNTLIYFFIKISPTINKYFFDMK